MSPKSYAEWKKAQKEKKDQNGDKGAIFLTQATRGNVNTTQLFDKNQMEGGSEYDSYVTSCEKNPVQFKTFVQAVERPRLLHHNKGEDNSIVHTMLKGMDAQGSGESELLVLEENIDMAILDTGCAGSAAGREWVEDHIENLCPEDKTAIRRREGREYT